MTAPESRRLTSQSEEELGVGPRLFEPLDEHVHRLDRPEALHGAAQIVDAQHFLGVVDELFLARTRAVDVDRGENALVGKAAVEVELHVAGALELLEDDLVHAAAGVDERRAEDGQTAAALDVARRTEETLRLLERRGLDTTQIGRASC